MLTVANPLTLPEKVILESILLSHTAPQTEGLSDRNETGKIFFFFVPRFLISFEKVTPHRFLEFKVYAPHEVKSGELLVGRNRAAVFLLFWNGLNISPF